MQNTQENNDSPVDGHRTEKEDAKKKKKKLLPSILFQLGSLPWCKHEDALTTPAAPVHCCRTPWCDLSSPLKTQTKPRQQNGRHNNKTATAQQIFKHAFLTVTSFVWKFN